MEQTPLYRPEVTEAKRNRWLGHLILRQPLSHWMLSWCAMLYASSKRSARGLVRALCRFSQASSE